MSRQCRLAIDISQLGAGLTISDPDLLARAFRHVIDNAVRHADGTVAVSVSTEHDQVVVRVDDDGTQAGPASAVTAGIVRAHGGEVTVEDAPLGGARFVIWLPASETLAS